MVKLLQGTYAYCDTLILVYNLFVVIKELMTRNWEVKLEYIYREQNKVVDCLASMSMMHDHGVQILSLLKKLASSQAWSTPPCP